MTRALSCAAFVTGMVLIVLMSRMVAVDDRFIIVGDNGLGGAGEDADGVVADDVYGCHENLCAVTI